MISIDRLDAIPDRLLNIEGSVAITHNFLSLRNLRRVVNEDVRACTRDSSAKNDDKLPSSRLRHVVNEGVCGPTVNGDNASSNLRHVVNEGICGPTVNGDNASSNLRHVVNEGVCGPTVDEVGLQSMTDRVVDAFGLVEESGQVERWLADRRRDGLL
ncbi:hypothetical protein SARC_13708 [Sphaeroforma arctica JP610]|uniref:Uncharacterized protein n=1 Tax=Sphaeroforma arctica JP610 TaxID=667725 RepID=A0A0L0FAG5_9EUKA|nr:hypothetical protein SARC_13708 [Sphaeroforma arctica JP610]KNC73734.1 hypothetical protein SARC_13708 [Sphaeroforma arctica JP610]|eukprot:XP_014147636.1 hypothetical protein SARC_13708 [Sphaeroforma arctica JP610]